ncbi:MAG TPA: corrinoid protein [Armatimonadota bacterium]|nr:corrinoid protein [Armatimonadota bacterium]HOM71949.1 corrinoid protein [Armatimonadota bacterium]HPP76104.1 corrinoid protein [Armatimonadota bacterium]
MADLVGLAQAIIYRDQAKAEELTKQAIEEGVAPDVILNEGLVAGMNVVGQKFKANEFYVPEVLIAARTMQRAMEHLRPVLIEAGTEPVAKVIIGTVKGDLHDIGKNLVAMMLEGAGFEIIDLGVDVSPEKFVASVQEKDARIVALSALLTTTMPAMRDTIAAFDSAGLRDKIRVMVGGAPVTQNFADEIGADGYAPDAASAVDTAKQLAGVTA